MKKILISFILLSAALLYCSCGTKITITFDPNNGIDMPQAVTAVSGSASPASVPIKEGYFFGGWWTEKEGGQQWLFSEREIYDGMILYAHWLDTVITVSFESNLPATESLKTFQTENQALAHGSKVIKPDEPELNGEDYFFKGWSKSADVFTPWVFGTDTVSENTTIYAFWERFAVVSFDLGLGGGEEIDGGLINDKKVRSGSRVSVPANLKTKTQEHLFAGWYTDAAFLQKWYESNTVSGNIILYAKWDESVRVNFDINAPQDADIDWDYPTEYILRKNTSLYEAFSENKSLEWFTERRLIPYDRNYMYAVNTWFYSDSGGEEKIFTADKILSEDSRIYAVWREADYYIFDGVYYELFHPVTQEENEGREFLNLGDLPYYQGTGSRNGYFAGWFYKSNPSLQYFGEKVQPHTEFVSKTFNVTSNSCFDFILEEEEYYAVLKDTFTSSELVLPQFLSYSKGGEYFTVDKFRIDLTAFQNIETIVFAGHQLYNLKYYVSIIYPQDNKKINFYGEFFGYNYCVYDNFVYRYYKTDIEEYRQMPYHNTETSERNFNYCSFTISFAVRSDYTVPAKVLPQGFMSNECKFPVILEPRFLDYYHQGLKNKVIFCHSGDMEFVKSLIAEGIFYGSVVYDINCLENAEANYLILNNELIYYMCRRAANGSRLIVDLTREEFSSVTRINTNSIIFNTAAEGTVSSDSADLYIPGSIRQIESRAVSWSMNLNVYLLGECPDIIYRANDSSYYYAEEGEAAAFHIDYNAPHNSVNYYDIQLNYFIDAQYLGSYGDWVAKIQASGLKVYIEALNYI